MKYLLDTCAVSDFVKGDKNTLEKIKHISPGEIAISTITIMEIQYGLALNAHFSKKAKSIISDFISVVNKLDFTQGDAEHAAVVRALLRQHGNPIGAYDVLLAGTALNHELIFVSSNTKEF